MVDSLIDKVNEKTSNQIHDNNKVQQHPQRTKTFYPKFIPRLTKTLLIVHTKKYKQKIWAQVQLYTPILQQKQYNGYRNIENLIIHVGHNKIDSGYSGFETASFLMENVSEIIKKLSQLKVALGKIPPVKDGFFGRRKINEKIDNYNEALENVATELSGVFDFDVVFF